MGKATDTYQQTYDKLLLAGDFNAENTEHVCYNACLSMMLLTLWMKKPVSKAKITPVVLAFLSQVLLIVFKIHQQWQQSCLTFIKWL